MTYGLTNFDTINIAKKNEIFDEIEVWQGTQKTIKSYINEDVYQTIPKAKKKLIIVKKGDHSLSNKKWLSIILKELKLLIN